MGELTDLVEKLVEKYDDYCKQKIVEELEKIKAEMNVELFKEYSTEREFDSGYESCLKQQIDRIDNHIKELKGEQKWKLKNLLPNF